MRERRYPQGPVDKFEAANSAATSCYFIVWLSESLSMDHLDLNIKSLGKLSVKRELHAILWCLIRLFVVYPRFFGG